MAIGSLLSTALAGCAHQADRPAPAPAPAAIAIRIEDPAPAELLVCPTAPVGFPEDAAATMPVGVRTAAIALAAAYAAAAAQLARLINWNAPGRCAK
jgi:hypothetical protein